MGNYVNFNDTLYEITVDNMKLQIEQLNRGTFENPCSRHRHGKNFYELHLVCSGKGTLVTDEGEYSLKGGTLYMTGPEIAHAQLTDKAFPMTEYCLGMSVSGRNGGQNSDLSESFLREHYGKTFSQMKREARINKAKELVGDGHSVEDAAEAVGYKDTKAFLSALNKAGIKHI